jgi:hypothetical protein
MSKNKRYELFCDTCGSYDIVHQTFSEWDTEKQEWVFSYMGDDVYCHDCCERVAYDMKEIKDER